MARFLVVVNPPKPKPAMQGTSTYKVADLPRVEWVTAPSKEQAAQNARVEPGGSAHVVADHDVETFKRAEMAPLVSDAPKEDVAHAL